MQAIKENILLFGSSYMAEEYLKVIRALDCEVMVVGRDQAKASQLAEKYKAVGFGGGVNALDHISVKEIDLVIIASAVESLAEVACRCLIKGFNRILLEKPGALGLAGLEKIKSLLKSGHKLGIAYNRRFYNSVIQLRKKINEDGGPVGCFFDFTDREKDILGSVKAKEVVQRWGFANSTHVIDTAFYLAGYPEEMHVLRAGSFEQHPTGNVFVGCGETPNCLFSYFSTWGGGGRWSVEISTRKGRYRLSPMEELQFCQKNQFAWETIVSPDEDDKLYKPGLYKMVSRVLAENFQDLPTIEDQIRLCQVTNRIFGYEN